MANEIDAVGLRQICSLFEGGATGGLTDGELLERFRDGDPPASKHAFRTLVGRHGAMVFRVARSIVRDPHDAADAFQATFLVLARKADSLRVTDALGPWLHGVARRIAANLRSSAIRRREKEGRAIEHISTSDVDDLAQVLDEEIGRLPDRYRAAVVLCLVEGLTQEQAAHQLGWPSGTVRSRLARGREQLRGQLTRRGLAPSGLLMGASAASEASAPALLESAVQIATACRSGRSIAEVASATVIALSSTFIGSFLMTRIKIAAIVIVATCLGAAGASNLLLPKPNDPPALAKVEPTRPTRWRYQLARLLMETSLAEKANEEAAKGWEVVEVVPVVTNSGTYINMQYTILFRRPADATD